MNIDLNKLEDEVKESIASSAFVSMDVLEFLSKDENSEVRAKVANNSVCRTCA